MPVQTKQMKVENVILIHCGNFIEDIVKHIKKTLENYINPQYGVNYTRKVKNIDSLVADINNVCVSRSLDESIRGVLIITNELLLMLKESSVDARNKFQVGLMSKADNGLPLFAYIKHQVQEHQVREMLPDLQLSRMMDLSPIIDQSMCIQIYKQWFGKKAYINDKGNHDIETEQSSIRLVHIIHAGEENSYLRTLLDAVESTVDPERTCMMRRMYNPGDDVATEMMKDISKFLESRREKNEDKAIIIISDRFRAALEMSPAVKKEIKKLLIGDCLRETSKVSNFVLVNMSDEEGIFDSLSGILNGITLTKEISEDPIQVADNANDIWFKPIRKPEESTYNSGDFSAVNAQPQSTYSSTIGSVPGKVVPSNYSSIKTHQIHNPTDGEFVCGRSPSPPHATIALTTPDPLLRDEVYQLQNKPRIVEQCPSENPASLESNPPDAVPKCPTLSLVTTTTCQGIKDEGSAMDGNIVATGFDSVNVAHMIKDDPADVTNCFTSLRSTVSPLKPTEDSGPKSWPNLMKPLDNDTSTITAGAKTPGQENLSSWREKHLSKVPNPANPNNIDLSDLFVGMNVDCEEALANCLDLKIPCIHSWLNLAGYYRVPKTTIQVWENKMPHVSAARNLFEWLNISKPDLTIAQVKKDLEWYKRQDALEILKRYNY